MAIKLYRSKVVEDENEYMEDCRPGVKIPVVMLLPESGDFGGSDYSAMCNYIKEDLVERSTGFFEPISSCDYNHTTRGISDIVSLPQKAMSKQEFEAYLDEKGFIHNPDMDSNIETYMAEKTE